MNRQKIIIRLSIALAFIAAILSFLILTLLNDLISEHEKPILILAVSLTVGITIFLISLKKLRKNEEDYNEQPDSAIKTKVKNHYRQNSAFEKQIQQSFKNKRK